MPKTSRHESAIRDRLNEIECEFAVKQQELERLRDEIIVLEAVLKAAEGKESDA